MIDLIRKRHECDGWIVFQELGDKPAFSSRRADAVALGAWRSKKYEAHYYENKISREDVKRELRDPRKAEGVGKYCHYWWLVIDDEKRIADLVVPDIWGILVVKVDTVAGKEHRRLSVVRKAPKLKPEPFTAQFVVAAVRNIRRTYVDPTDHQRVADELSELKRGKTRAELSDEERTDKDKIHDLERELSRLRGYIEQFEERSGVELGAESWEWGNIGDAVKIARQLASKDHANGDILKAVAALSTASEVLEKQSKEIAESAVRLRQIHRMHAGLACAPSCASLRKYHPGRCDCGQHPLSVIEKQLAAPSARPMLVTGDSQ